MRVIVRIASAIAAAVIAITPIVAGAQTDYFNTDRGRPLRVQDALAIERYAFELQAAPLTIARTPGEGAVWSVEPELAYGILARTQLEVGLPLYVIDEGSSRRGGVGAVHVSLLHALNVETLGMPALAVDASTTIAAGRFGPADSYVTLGAIMTRTLGFGRLHVNADATIGPEPAGTTGPKPGLDEVTRWSAGAAIDHAFPLRSLLIGAEVVAGQPITNASDVEWRAGAGVRWQASPQWSFDAGLSRTFTDTREWSLTFGAARAFALLNLLPINR